MQHPMNTPAGNRRRRGRKTILLGLAISLVLVGVLLARVNLGNAFRAIARIEGRRLLLPLAVTLVSIPFRPWRWQIIFPAAMRPGFWSCFNVLYISNFSNNLLPARGGDVLRCFLIRRDIPGASLIVAFATLGLEKLFDGLGLLFVVLFSFLFLSPPRWLGHLTLIAALLFGGVFAVIFALRLWPGPLHRLIAKSFGALRLPGLGQQISALLDKFSAGLSIVNSPRQLAAVAILTTITWIGEALFFWAIAPALGISISIANAIVISAVLGLGLMIPAGPAFIGSYEFFIVYIMAFLGVKADNALALALIIHAWVLVLSTVLGFITMGATGIRFFSLLRGTVTNDDTRQKDVDSCSLR